MEKRIGYDGISKSTPKEKLDTSNIEKKTTSSNKPANLKELPKDINTTPSAGKNKQAKDNKGKNPSSGEIPEEGFKSADYSNINVGNKKNSSFDLNEKINNSKLPQFAKNRLNDSVNKAKKNLNRFNSDNINKANDLRRKFKRFMKIGKSVISFIARFWWLILAIIVVVFGLIPLIIAIAMQVGNSPHYYCNLDAPQTIRASKVYQQYCGGFIGGNDSIAQAAVTLAYELGDMNASEPHTYVAGKCSSGVSHSSTGKAGPYPADIATQLYVDVHDSVIDGDGYYASCDRGTCTAVRWSGADDDFPPGACPTIMTYLENHPEKWEKIGVLGDDIQFQEDEQNLQPGDIMVCSGHIGIYVGPEAIQEKYPNSTCTTYAASYGDYCPQLQGDHWKNGHGSSGEKYTVYRNIKPEEASKYKDLQF